MDFIDSHAHLYLPEFDADRGTVLERAKDTGVISILLPAIDSQTHVQMVQTEQQYPQCKAMIGLHPCSVNEHVQEELKEVENWLKARPFVAIGEIGLDFYWDTTFTAQQYHAFEQQIQLALAYQLPIVIHSRNATAECIEVVRRYPGVTGVFHCFSGTEEQAKAVIDAGLLLGIGGVITYKNAGLDKIIAAIDLNSVVLETDAPYLSPAPYRGKRNESSYLKFAAEKIATIKGVSIEKVAEITTENAKKLFKLNR
ncbi:MAG: TatD family hydrolase [Flavisolibacter sp.]|nr:TatD family hydrolase [Flavisolibacter sp.]